jgi:NADH:quinone reductase (non-electrogenic)
MSTTRKQILILGGGFAGVYTARCLERLLRPDEATITLVNRENYWVYQPMLPEVISGSIALTNVVSPIRRLCPRTHLVMREVEDIDLKNKTVILSPGFRPRQLQLSYDYLVIALGNITNYYGMPGMIENARPFRTLAAAIALRNHLIHVLEEADVEQDPALREKLMTFVVGGGGFSGVELMAELNDFVHSVKRTYLRLRDHPHRCVIVQAGERILPEMAEPLAVFAQKIMRKRGVEIILNDRLSAATSEKAILGSGKEIPCKTIISTVPSALPPMVEKLDCAKERGKLLVDTGLALKGFEGQVWALGDCAYVHTLLGSIAPPTAQHAIREATTVAINIATAAHGGKQARFAFEGLGTLGSLGHGSAVAQVFGLKVSGLAAWFLWRCIYLMKMPGHQPQSAHCKRLAAAHPVPPRSGANQGRGRIQCKTTAFRARGTRVRSGRSRRQRLCDQIRRMRGLAQGKRRGQAARHVAQRRLLRRNGSPVRQDPQRSDKSEDFLGCFAHSKDGFRPASPEYSRVWRCLWRPREETCSGE